MKLGVIGRSAGFDLFDRHRQKLGELGADLGFAGGNTSGPGTAYAAAVLKDAPVAYWRFEETQGDSAKNEVAGAPAGTYFGAFRLASPGIPGGGAAVNPYPSVRAAC